MIIDIFNHFYPTKFLKAYIKTKHSWILNGFKIEPAAWTHSDPETRIKEMDALGIDIQVMGLAMSPIVVTIDFPIELVKSANDGIAEVVEKYPERFIGLASLPFLTGEALDELDRCIKDLGLKGVYIYLNDLAGGKPLDSPEYMPFYEKMSRYDLPILIHPTRHGLEEFGWIRENNQSLDWPFYSTLAMGMLVYGGVLQRFPNLKVVIHHLGGNVPYYHKRIERRWEQNIAIPERAQKLKLEKTNVIEYFKMFYADTATDGSFAAMRCGYDFFGPEHVVFATDYPHVRGKYVEAIIKTVKELDIPEENKQMIFEGNARKLLKMK